MTESVFLQIRTGLSVGGVTLSLELVRTENANPLTPRRSDNTVCTRMCNVSKAVGSNLVPGEQRPRNQMSSIQISTLPLSC